MSAPPPPPPPMGLKSQPRPPPIPSKKAKASATKNEQPTRTSISRSFDYFNEKSSLGSGLSNQGATCYVNSLLQTLYYTPEFRSKIYEWKSDTEFDPLFCIPVQLQKLFARMQYGLTNSVETKQLTNSFGWEEGDAFEQHDVQELTHVLFDAIERTFKKGSNNTSSFVSHFYKGIMTDYIQCKKCKNTRKRKDDFLDLQLTVRGMANINDALKSFITPEELSGDNKVSCEKCDDKCDAEKGLSLTVLPPILTLQLKRFDFDYATWRRLKLNNKVEFPFELDMTPYVEKPEVEDNKEKGTQETKDTAETKDTKEKVDLKDSKSETIKNDNDKTEDEKKKEKERQLLYELFSVMVHSGGASGGHYYAFVKKIDNGAWIKVNDITVTPASEEEIYQMFGEDTGGKAAPLSSTNAYMLHYRLKSANKAFPIAEVPENIKAEINVENEQFLKEKAEFIKRRDNLTLKVTYLDNTYIVNIDKHKSLNDLHAIVHSTLSSALSQSTPTESTPSEPATSQFTAGPSDMRLRQFTTSTQTVGEVWDLGADGAKSLDSLGFFPNRVIVAETREPGAEFDAISKDISLKILPLDENLEFMPEKVVTLSRDSTLSDLREKIFKDFFHDHSPSASLVQILRVVQNTQNNMQQEIFVVEGKGGGKEETLHELGLIDGTVLYVERRPDDGVGSSLQKRFEMELHMVEISFNKPGSKVFDQPLGIDKRKSLRELKMKIGKLLDIPVEEIKVCKNMISGEFKGLDSSIDDCGIFDGCTVFVEKGKPMNQGEVRIGLVQKKQEDEFTKLTEVTVSDKLPVSELRKLASEKTSWEFVRLRERRGNKAANILVDGENLKEAISVLKDGTEVVVEKLDKQEYLQKSQMLLQIRGVDPSSWELSPSKEVLVNKNTTTVDDILQIVSQQENIEVKFLQIAKPIRFHLTEPAMIYGLNWEVDFARVLTKSPWYLVDGDFLYWKDIRIQEKVPENASAMSKQREKGLKIYTPYDDDFEIYVEETDEKKDDKKE